jgi:hypothetical protein
MRFLLACLLTACAASPPSVVSAATVAPAPRDVADDLRALVGMRTHESPVQFALVTAATLLGPLAPDVTAVDDCDHLADIATAHHASSDTALPGDLMILGDTVAVVVSVEPEAPHTMEILYLQGKIVRRGFATLESPTARRDAHGHALNTIVRPYRKSDHAGRKYLAGELYTGVIRSTALLAR